MHIAHSIVELVGSDAKVIKKAIDVNSAVMVCNVHNM